MIGYYLWPALTPTLSPRRGSASITPRRFREVMPRPSTCASAWIGSRAPVHGEPLRFRNRALGPGTTRQRLGLRQSSAAFGRAKVIEKRQRTGTLQNLAAEGTVHGKGEAPAEPRISLPSQALGFDHGSVGASAYRVQGGVSRARMFWSRGDPKLECMSASTNALPLPTPEGDNQPNLNVLPPPAPKLFTPCLEQGG
jgi:hypothetical protein